MTEEYNDILDKIHSHNLQFLGLIDMSRDAAIEKIKALNPSAYRSLKFSVNYHAGKPAINKKLSVRSIPTLPNAIASPAKIAEKTAAKPITVDETYKTILNPSTDVKDINPKYIQLREEYLNELQALENSPGCSSCQKGKLKRKYIEKLTALDKANSES